MPGLPGGVRRAFRLAVRRPAIERDVDAEIAFHLEMRAAELVARGLTHDAARAEARRRFGDPRRWSEAMSAEDRDRTTTERRTEWLDDLRQDVRYGVRAALRAPLFSLLAVVTLALGIGANAAVFGVVKSVLLDALPYRDADRLVGVYGRFLDGSHERGPLSAGTVVDLAERQRSFERVAYYASVDDVVVGGVDDGPQVATRAWVDPGLFATLGVPPALGRDLVANDARDTVQVVLLSHGAWQRMFGGAPSAIGRDVRLNNIPRTVVGVLPAGFVGPMGEADFYFPLTLQPRLRDPVGARGSHWLGMVARLRSGVPHAAAERDLEVIAEQLAAEHQENASIRLSAVPLRDAIVGDTRMPLLVLMASAGLVLLVTCANLAGALLSRTLTRRREFAVRVAMGAGRGRIARQLLTESTVLALAGGATGLLLAALGLAALRRLAVSALPPYAELALDPGAVVVTAAVALLTGISFGVVPALAAGRANVQGTLREESRGASEGRRTRHLRGVLVAGQIALCVSLLAGAGLLARSLWAMTTASPGFDAHGVLTVDVAVPPGRYSTPAELAAFHAAFLERLGALPGVRGVANAGGLPTTFGSRNGITAIEGQASPPADAIPFVLYAGVSDDYFRTLRIPLRAGRTFDARDHAEAPPAVVISESMARRYWPNGDAVGGRFRMGPDPDAPLITVVGVVGDVRNDPARADAEPMAYGSTRQNPWDAATYVLRTDGDPLALASAVRRELAAVDPAIPVQRMIPLRALLSEGLAGRRLPVVLMAAFGALALILASVGVYAMFASMAAAREREFGVRVALGATRRGIAGLVLRQGGTWMLAGLAGGALGVVAVARLVRGLLYGVAPFDPLVLGLAVLALLVCAALALLVPVRRATRADPVSVLR